jgi:hypothetical protein
VSNKLENEMDGKHTQGPLEVDETGEYIQQVGATDVGIASIMNIDVGGSKGWFHGPITTANARRLAACWNACQGIPTKALEVGTTMSDLLEALRKCKTAALPTEVRDFVNAAIAKATGSAS